jgi:PAS domain S-box-containing protein
MDHFRKDIASNDAGIDMPEITARLQELELIFNTSIDIMFLLSVEGNDHYRFTSVNQAFLRATGLRREQVEGAYATNVIPPSSQPLVFSKYKQAIQQRQTIQWEETSEYPSGTKTGIVSITPVFNEQQECTRLVGTVHDISERKKTEQENETIRYLLNERVKELTTLYQVCKLLQSETQSAPVELSELVSILPLGWQYPDITEARISYAGKEYSTPGFANGIHKQAATFDTRYGHTGSIEIAYTSEIPAEAEGPFLNEERSLINMLAEMLRIYFDRLAETNQLLKEKELSESIINSLPGIFYLQEITGEFVLWNKQLEMVTGYNKDEIQKVHSLDFFDENDRQLILKKSDEVYKNGEADLEATIITKIGKKIPHYFTGRLIDYEGRPCVIGTAIDITERRQAAEQLLKEKELSESIINSLPGIFYLFDHNGKYLRWNKNHETVPGYTEEEMQTMYPLNFFDDEEKELIARRINRVFTEGYADVEANFMGKNGRKIPYYFNGVAINYEDKPCLMGVGIDITERKKMEKELRDAEIKFRTLVEKSQVGVYIVQKGKFVYVNPRFAEIFGYGPDELLGLDPVYTIISEEFRDLTREHVRARMEGEKEAVHYEVTGKRKDGTLNRVEFYGSRAIYEGQATIIGTMIDITERKLAEEALQKSEANLHTIFDNTDTIYALLDKNFRVVSINQRAADFVRKELHGKFQRHKSLIDYFPEERRASLQERMERVLTGEHISYESNYQQEDGSMTWYDVRMLPITDNEKKILGMMMAVSDITEKKLLEQAIVNQKVQEQKKMTRAVLNAQEKERNKIGQELHDNVNQILAGSKMLMGLMKSKKQGDEELIDKSISLIDSAINEIRVLTRDQVTPQRRIDLEDLVRSLVDNLNEHAGMEADFVYDIDGLLITDDLKLNIYRIIQEGINNVLKHAKARQVTVVVKGDPDGLHVVITDDGSGFDTVATKSRGVGMANIQNRVESYNGKILVESSPGNGCRIELSIPV